MMRMSETSFLKRRWKLLLNIITILALALLAYAIRHQLAATIDSLPKVRIWAVLLLIPVEALNYHAQTKMYQGLFASVEERLPYRKLLRASLELNFVNHVFPSGGVSGISYFGFWMRRLGVRGTKATLVQTMKLLLLFMSFELILFAGMIILAVNGRASNVVVLIASVLTTLVVVGTGAFVYVIGSQARINAFLMSVTMFINRLIHVVRRRHPETISLTAARRVFGDLHNDYRLMHSRLHALQAPFWWALVANATEVAAVYVVYIAFNAYVNVGAVILAYAVANFAGLVSVLPGGTGIYEALMTVVLVATGIPARLSLPVTIMYRVLNTLIQVPPGYVLYHLTLSASGGNEVPSSAANEA